MIASKLISRMWILGFELVVCIIFGVIASDAIAAQATLAWDPNTESDLAGYRIHYGTASGSYTVHTDVRNVTTYTVTGLTAGQTYYFAATAYDASGNESGFSNPVSYAVATAPIQAPDAPLLVSLVNTVGVGVMAVLKTGAFRTAVAGTTHAKTRWQVFRDEDDACVLDIQSATALTTLTVPKLVLEEGTKYFWRAQFTDSKGNISEWPAYGYFTTETTNADLNANGIPDVQEVGSTVDLDRDGVKDNMQPRYIKSVKMEGTNVQIGVSIKGCPTCIGVESVESEDVRQQDSYAYGKPTSMPFALINFKIAVAKVGDQAVVKMHFSKSASYSSKWYKYDPIADKWYDFSAFAKFASDRRSVTLTLTDGGPGDADGVANGVIVDPAGIVEVQEEIVMFRAKPRALRQGLRRK